MAIGNEDLIRKAFDALNRHDLEGFLELIEPDVEFNSLIAEADARSFHGHDGVREWWETVLESLGGLHWELEEIQLRGEEWATVKLRVIGEASGVPIEQTMWQGNHRRGERADWWHVGRTEEDVLAAMREAGYDG